jgi:hypothetical protein
MRPLVYVQFRIDGLSVFCSQCHQILRAYYGKQVTESFAEGYVTKWWTDPFSRGSYRHVVTHIAATRSLTPRSYLPVGSSPNDYTIMSEPVFDEHVLFAGEHSTK